MDLALTKGVQELEDLVLIQVDLPIMLEDLDLEDLDPILVNQV